MPESLEQLDLLLIHELRRRRVRSDGIHFHSFRYLSLTLAAYVGEDVTIRYDPRDMGEIRVLYRDKFLCRAISADLAGQTVPLRDIVRARNQRRQELRAIVKSRRQTVDTLLKLKRNDRREEAYVRTDAPAEPQRPRLKRYYNEFLSRRWSTENSSSFARLAGATALSVSAMGRPVSTRPFPVSTSAEAHAPCRLTAGAFAPQTDSRWTPSSTHPM